MSGSEYKTWLVEIPDQLYVEVKLRSVLTNQKIVHMANSAAATFIRDVRDKKCDPKDILEKDELAKGDHRQWTFQLDWDLYSEIKKLCIDARIGVFKGVTAMFIYYLRNEAESKK